MIRLAPGLALLLAASPAAAGPAPDYFRGLYERVGRDASTPAELVDDKVRIDPMGTALVMRDCAGGAVKLAPVDVMESDRLLTASDGADTLWCEYHNNFQNYPVITCLSEAGARYTLWPVEGDFADGKLVCDG